MNHILEVSGLKKAYGTVEAVRGIDFYVEEGALFAFLGPNGAGKSTTISILCTLLAPDAGQVIVDGSRLGMQDFAIKQAIGVVFQEGVLDALLTVRENLMVRGRFYGLSGAALKHAVQTAADAAGVRELLDRRYGKLSGGQRRRADIARALIHMPRLLFLDEPTTGLDPQTRRSIWETIREIQRARGMTVFLTTHYMEEAADADQIHIIDQGAIAARGTPNALREQYSRDWLRLSCADEQAVRAVLQRHGLHARTGDGCLTVRLPQTLDAIAVLQECRGLLTNFEVGNGTMDDVFLEITGKGLREA